VTFENFYICIHTCMYEFIEILKSRNVWRGNFWDILYMNLHMYTCAKNWDSGNALFVYTKFSMYVLNLATVWLLRISLCTARQLLRKCVCVCIHVYLSPKLGQSYLRISIRIVQQISRNCVCVRIFIYLCQKLGLGHKGSVVNSLWECLQRLVLSFDTYVYTYMYTYIYIYIYISIRSSNKGSVLDASK